MRERARERERDGKEGVRGETEERKGRRGTARAEVRKASKWKLRD